MIKEDLAGMDLDSLRELRKRLLLQRKDEVSRIAEADSPFGIQIRERKQAELDTVRSEYNSIKVLGVPDRDVILKLYAIQLRERFIMADLAVFDAQKKSLQALDSDISLCDAIVKSNESSPQRKR